MKTTWLLDPGHGIDTKGKRSPFIPPGVREYEFNRDIMRRIMRESPGDVLPLVSAEESLPLRERVLFAELLAGDNLPISKTFLVSIHANAAGNGREWTDAKGSCVFVAKNCSEESARFAGLLAPMLSEALETRDRGVKRKNLYMVRRPSMPAVLAECGFMTNEGEATKLADPEQRAMIAAAFIQAMIRFENSYSGG